MSGGITITVNNNSQTSENITVFITSVSERKVTGDAKSIDWNASNSWENQKPGVDYIILGYNNVENVFSTQNLTLDENTTLNFHGDFNIHIGTPVNRKKH
jgi:hypothetical protein